MTARRPLGAAPPRLVGASPSAPSFDPLPAHRARLHRRGAVVHAGHSFPSPLPDRPPPTPPHRWGVGSRCTPPPPPGVRLPVAPWIARSLASWRRQGLPPRQTPPPPPTTTTTAIIPHPTHRRHCRRCRRCRRGRPAAAVCRRRGAQPPFHPLLDPPPQAEGRGCCGQSHWRPSRSGRVFVSPYDRKNPRVTRVHGRLPHPDRARGVGGCVGRGAAEAWQRHDDTRWSPVHPPPLPASLPPPPQPRGRGAGGSVRRTPGAPAGGGRPCSVRGRRCPLALTCPPLSPFRLSRRCPPPCSFFLFHPTMAS